MTSRLSFNSAAKGNFGRTIKIISYEFCSKQSITSNSLTSDMSESERKLTTVEK
jgi:hypothetical protein